MSVIISGVPQLPPGVPVLPGRLFAVDHGRDEPPVDRSPSDSGLGIPGLAYLPEFLDESEESRIVEEIDRSEWNTDLTRRVQHYGWTYDYRQREVADSMRLGDLPTWAATIAGRLVGAGLLAEMPDQVIVNEYLGNQGISRHRDHPRFADGIATVSLLESWEMVFRRRDEPQDRRAFVLERRSVAVMTGEARYEWTHEIPQRKSEPVTGPGGERRGWRPRGRRLSLTFRQVLPDRAVRPDSPTRPRYAAH